MLSVGLLLYLRKRKIGNGPGKTYLPFLVIFIVLIAPGATFLAIHPTSSQMIIGDGYISISGQFIGSNNYTSSDIQTAFVGNIHYGNLTLSKKIEGSGGGNLVSNEGTFTLSNGAKADVITVNSTALFVELKSGLYLVLGTSNTSNLVSVFSNDVFPVSAAS